MALSEDEKEMIKDTLRDLYKQVPDTGYNMSACWNRDAKGNITGTVDIGCLREGGRKIGSEIRSLWGK